MNKRPPTRPIDELNESDRFQFDVESLSEDRWISDKASGRLEVETLYDGDLPLSTIINRIQRQSPKMDRGGCTQLRTAVERIVW